MSHLCHALRCSAPVPPLALMCDHHWAMVPADLRLGIIRRYRPGQEVDKAPSDAYVAVAWSAVVMVANAEGIPSP